MLSSLAWAGSWNTQFTSRCKLQYSWSIVLGSDWNKISLSGGRSVPLLHLCHKFELYRTHVLFHFCHHWVKSPGESQLIISITSYPSIVVVLQLFWTDIRLSQTYPYVFVSMYSNMCRPIMQKASLGDIWRWCYHIVYNIVASSWGEEMEITVKGINQPKTDQYQHYVIHHLLNISHSVTMWESPVVDSCPQRSPR